MPENSGSWPDALIGSLRELLEKLFEPRTLKLLVLAAVAIAVAMLDPGRAVHSDLRIGQLTLSALITWIFILIGTFLALGTILSGLYEFHTARRAASFKQPAVTAVPVAPYLVIGAEVVIGLDVGRHLLSYGAAQFKVPTAPGGHTSLRNVRLTELVPTRNLVVGPHESRRQLYDHMVQAVSDTIDAIESAAPQTRVSAMSVTTPSWIDIAAKSLASPIGPFPVNESVAENLARYLWRQYPEKIRRVFGSPDSPVESQHDLLNRIFLDEDSRSAMRYDLHQRHQMGQSWQNYACVIILEGIGAGLVLGGEVYYGSHASEGEVGHTTVHLESEYRLPSVPGASIYIEKCACELPGMHWESISGTTAIIKLAEAIDKDRYQQLCNGLGHIASERDLLDLACLAKDVDCVNPVPVEARRLIMNDLAEYGTYFDRIFREYARLVTIGVANLANILDLEHVVIGGPLIKDLDRLGFRNNVRDFWNDYVLRGQTIGHSYKSLKQIWQGSTLLFWDTAYYRQWARPSSGVMLPLAMGMLPV